MKKKKKTGNRCSITTKILEEPFACIPQRTDNEARKDSPQNFPTNKTSDTNLIL